MNVIQSLSLLSLIFGIVILANPAILAYIIATLFIIVGINGLVFGSRLSKIWKVKVKN